MKKIILVYGTIAGVVVILSMVTGFALSDGQGNFSSQWFGYLTMIVALSLIFIGIKRYRDTELGGVIKFGKAFQVGLGIAVVAAMAYVVTWEIYLVATDHAFIETYSESVLEQKRAEGLSGDALAEEEARMAEMVENYGKPYIRVPITFLEIFPVGLLIALISAGLLRNPRVLPARAVA